VPIIETDNTNNYKANCITVYDSLKPMPACTETKRILSAEYNRVFRVIPTKSNYCFPQNHQYIYVCSTDVQYRRAPSKKANQAAPNSRENTKLNNENGFISIVFQLWLKRREN